MTTPLVLGIALCITLMVWAVRTGRRNAQRRIERAQYIASYIFPTSLRFKLDQAYPDFTGEQVGMILQGLRVWFQLVAANPRTQLGMPSQAVDKAWHEFILLTKNYADFCDNAFGKFLHHTPHSVGDKAQKDGLARTYGLGARAAGGAALMGMASVAGVAGAAALSGRDLFSLDQTLGVPDGNSYTANDLSDLDKRYQQMQTSSGEGGGDTGTTGSDGNQGSDSGSGGGDGGGCGGGCGS